MFLQFYGLSEQPFGVTPDPAYLYPSSTHCEALTALTNGILASRGFLALVAEPGMGKTTLLYELLDELRDSARTVFLFQTQCDSREFFSYLLAELGVETQGMGLVAMHSKLNEVLFDEMLKGKRFVLIVDEAQNLDESVLETVRLLSNFETQHTKLLQIILAGQPELARKLSNPKLSQLRQRIAVIGRLQPLSLSDTTAYVEHRLKVAGYRGEPLFTSDALALICEKSQGIPRAINNICFDALTKAHAQDSRTITAQIVRDVLNQLDLSLALPAPADARTIEPIPSAVPVNSASSHPLVVSPQADLPAANDIEGPSLNSSESSEILTISAARETQAEKEPQVTYKPVAKFKLARWTLRGVVLLATLGAIGLLSFPMIRSHATVMSQPEDHPAVAKLQPSFTADPQTAASGQLLTVVAGPNQTLQEISLLYLGKFDGGLLAQISSLNPQLKNGAPIQAGQLIRLPLPPGTLTKVSDDSYAGNASQQLKSTGATNTAQQSTIPANAPARTSQVAPDQPATK